jgi:hypothetical protein
MPAEFFAMFNTACPGLFGTPGEFRKNFEHPIVAGRDADASEHQLQRVRGRLGGEHAWRYASSQVQACCRRRGPWSGVGRAGSQGQGQPIPCLLMTPFPCAALAL